MAGAPVRKFYQSVVEDVIQNVKDAFADEGSDEQVLLELKQLWESKLQSSKAVELVSSEQEQILTRVHKSRQQIQPALTGAASSSTPAVRAVQAPQMVAHLPMFSAATGSAVSGLTAAGHAAAIALPPNFYQQQFALQGNSIIVQTPQGPFLATAAPGTITLPPNTRLDGSKQVLQFDGVNDSSSEEEEEEKFNGEEEDEVAEENEDQDGEDGDPLNSDDDISNDDDPSDVFDTENVVVCQFDKINRAKNKWRFHLKDGIMNLNGKDFVFQRANGEGDW